MNDVCGAKSAKKIIVCTLTTSSACLDLDLLDIVVRCAALSFRHCLCMDSKWNIYLNAITINENIAQIEDWRNGDGEKACRKVEKQKCKILSEALWVNKIHRLVQDADETQRLRRPFALRNLNIAITITILCLRFVGRHVLVNWICCAYTVEGELW